MLLIPAIDLKDGHCVRLKQGDMDQSTIFSEDPAAMARNWVSKGARRLHLVDLNGAFAGKPKNEAAIRRILTAPKPIRSGTACPTTRISILYTAFTPVRLISATSRARQTTAGALQRR